jgi:predicted transcriptional regulator
MYSRSHDDPERALGDFTTTSAILSAVLASRVGNRQVSEVMISPTAIAYPDEILRSVADRMAGFGVGVIPVVDRSDTKHIDGLITQFDLLAARQKLLEEERHAERVLTLRRVAAPGPGAGPATVISDCPQGAFDETPT